MDNSPLQNLLLKEYLEAGSMAKFYGFSPFKPPTLKKEDYDLTKNFNSSYHPEEKSAILRTYFEEKMYSVQPSMLWTTRPFPGSTERKHPHRLDCMFVTLGSTKSVCECLCIQAGVALLDSMGHKALEVRLNSVGDKESIADFERKYLYYIRKNIASFPSDLRQAIKKNPFVLVSNRNDNWKSFRDAAPKSIEFLSEPSRLHFKEVLEFLEVMNIPYSIDDSLQGDPDISSETIFSIFSNDTKEELATGMRSNRMARKIGAKKEAPIVTLNISVKLKKPMKEIRDRGHKPRFYLVQFGPEAKLKSFLILEELRKAGTHVVHSLAKDKLGSQIGVAENMNVPFILLVGQREALDNCVVVRNTLTRAQEIVPIRELSAKIKLFQDK